MPKTRGDATADGIEFLIWELGTEFFIEVFDFSHGFDQAGSIAYQRRYRQ